MSWRHPLLQLRSVPSTASQTVPHPSRSLLPVLKWWRHRVRQGKAAFLRRADSLIIGEGLLVIPEIEKAAAMAPPYASSATGGFAGSEARMRAD